MESEIGQYGHFVPQPTALTVTIEEARAIREGFLGETGSLAMQRVVNAVLSRRTAEPQPTALTDEDWNGIQEVIACLKTIPDWRLSEKLCGVIGHCEGFLSGLMLSYRRTAEPQPAEPSSAGFGIAHLTGKG